MIQFKIFAGTFDPKDPRHHADTKANDWIQKNPHIEIISMQYEHARYGDHSICIAYRTN